MELISRLRLYTRSVINYIFGVFILLGIGFLFGIVQKNYGLLLIVFTLPVVFVKLHYDICKSLTSHFGILRWKLLTPIFIISILLLTFKIYVNETINYHSSCFTKIAESSRLWNYFLYSIWTTIVLWELYYKLLSKILRHKLKNNSN